MFGYYCNNKWFTMVTFLGILFALICQNACCSPPSIVTDLDKTFGGPLEDEIHSIQLTSDGGYILTGSTKSNEGNSHDLLLEKQIRMEISFGRKLMVGLKMMRDTQQDWLQMAIS